MRSAAKKYNTNYKKRIDVFHDTFLPRRSPSGDHSMQRLRRLLSPAALDFNRAAGIQPIGAAAWDFLSGMPEDQGPFRQWGSRICVEWRNGIAVKSCDCCATKKRRRAKRIPWSGSCSWRRRGTVGEWKPRRRSWRSAWDVRCAKRAVARSLTTGRITTNSFGWCGIRVDWNTLSSLAKRSKLAL